MCDVTHKIQSSDIIFNVACELSQTHKIQSSDIIFNVACELSQPMGKTEFSSTAKNRTNSVS